MNSKERTELSKTLARILRHKASDEGLTIRADGYIELTTVLARPKLRKLRATLARVQEVVENDAKTRYTLRLEGDGQYWIRANQGHSIKVDDLELVEMMEVPVAIHGTYQRVLPAIMESGLKTMTRNHIHLAAGMPGTVKSGIRGNCDAFIHIDTKRAIADGIKFYESSNGVILTAGKDGVLEKKYFEEIQIRSQGQLDGLLNERIVGKGT